MNEQLGQVAYQAYCDAVGWKAINGDKLPPFAQQSARIQDAWIAAAEAVAQYLEKT
jgi:hypothetical protein